MEGRWTGAWGPSETRGFLRHTVVPVDMCENRPPDPWDLDVLGLLPREKDLNVLRRHPLTSTSGPKTVRVRQTVPTGAGRDGTTVFSQVSEPGPWWGRLEYRPSRNGPGTHYCKDPTSSVPLPVQRVYPTLPLRSRDSDQKG